MKRHLALATLVAMFLTFRPGAAALLSVDINDRTVVDTPNSVAGFEEWSIDTGTTAAVATATRTLASGYTVKFDVFDDADPNDGGSAGDNPGMFDDRDRVVPTTAPNYNQIYDDFIFAGGSAGPTGGLNLTISGGALLPNTQYGVWIYSYDGIDANMQSATQLRTANWLDGNNADALVLSTSFTINMPPTTDTAYRFTGVAMTDATGKLLLKGRRTTAGDVSVYINGFEIVEIPEPTTIGLSIVALGWIGSLCRRHRRA